jgi:hypothetical protein
LKQLPENFLCDRVAPIVLEISQAENLRQELFDKIISNELVR